MAYLGLRERLSEELGVDLFAEAPSGKTAAHFAAEACGA